MKMAAVHEQVLKELCFICGCILRGTVYDVDKFKDIVTGVTPMFFCNTCYRYFEVECF